MSVSRSRADVFAAELTDTAEEEDSFRTEVDQAEGSLLVAEAEGVGYGSLVPDNRT